MKNDTEPTKTEVTHTPTPWKVKAPEDGFNLEPVILGGADGIPVAMRVNSMANAAFIVRAVNSHEALVGALKTWKEFWDKMPKGQMGKLSFDVGLFNDGFVKMNKALAKAESR